MKRPKAADPSTPAALLLPGDPAPWFTQRSYANPTYAFDTAAGRYLVLCFLGSAGSERGSRALAAALAERSMFDDARMAFFGISTDPADESEGRLANMLPGFRFIWDFDRKVSTLYGDPDSRGRWVVLDPTLRVLNVTPFAPDGSEAAEVLAFLRALPPPERFAGPELQAPVLYLPDVFEPGFCQRLIGLYEEHGGDASGFMRDVGGKTVRLNDAGHKRRKDHIIDDQDMIEQSRTRVRRRIAPEILKAFQFQVTRMERYIVACYDAADRGFFNAHRDNTTKGTAHRRFAVSINLNDDFEGGEVFFPEYGPRSFKPPTGGAVVFSCSLLHAVTPVRRGRRYAFLPFLYDEAAAKIREQNNPHLGEEVGAYKA